MSERDPAAATVVLVHGAWGDGSNWRVVVPFLQAQGVVVLSLIDI